MQDSLRLALAAFRGAFRRNVSLRQFTHIRVGGPAEWFLEPYNEADLQAAVRACHDLDLPLRVMGGGSNLVVGDDGVRGAVVSLDSLNRVVVDGNRLTAGAGVTLPSLLVQARKLGLAGIEVLSGIPAVVGGAVAMNAGTREGATFDRLLSLTVVDADGEIRVLGKSDFAPVYRDGGLGDRIVVHATFELEEDDPKAIYDRFESYLKYRNATQPVAERSVGCVFRNPTDNSAGRLIEKAGCKLARRGGMQVSGKHANYFVNVGDGTADDFVALVDHVREKVSAEFQIELELEVKTWSVPGL